MTQTASVASLRWVGHMLRNRCATSSEQVGQLRRNPQLRSLTRMGMAGAALGKEEGLMTSDQTKTYPLPGLSPRGEGFPETGECANIIFYSYWKPSEPARG